MSIPDMPEHCTPFDFPTLPVRGIFYYKQNWRCLEDFSEFKPEFLVKIQRAYDEGLAREIKDQGELADSQVLFEAADALQKAAFTPKWFIKRLRTMACFAVLKENAAMAEEET